MNIKWIDQKIPYTGAELRSHFIYDQCDLLGDALIAFAGPCEVKLEKMVDLEDVKQKKPIYSENMLHFLGEHFHLSLSEMVLRQRLLMVLMIEELLSRKVSRKLRRVGDDLFDSEAKLTVSIATVTPTSCVFHAGINISSKNTPIPTRGLEDYQIAPAEFAESILKAYAQETQSIFRASCKVRGVS